LTFGTIVKEADFKVHKPMQFLTNLFCNLRGLLQLATDLEDQEIIQLIRKKKPITIQPE